MRTSCLFILLLIYGCAGHNVLLHRPPSGKVDHYQSILVYLPSVLVHEVFPGGVTEPVVRWSGLGNYNLAKASKKYFEHSGMDITILKKHKMEETDRKHIRLFALVSREIKRQKIGLDRWQHKIQQFDYSIGNGLSERASNNQLALMMGGNQYVRKILRDDSYKSIDYYPYRLIGFAPLHLTVALIELKSGNILWIDFIDNIAIDLRNPKEVEPFIDKIFKRIPLNYITSFGQAIQ